MVGCQIVGIGSFLPGEAISNDRFIKQGWKTPSDSNYRHHAGSDDSSVRMGVQAARRALEHACLKPDAVDLVLCFSGMPDFHFPKDGNLVLEELGITNAACWNVDTACASFISALNIAQAMITTERFQCVLVVMTMNWVHRGMDPATNIASLGDGAAAVVVQAGRRDSLLGAVERTDPEGFDFVQLKSSDATHKGETFSFSSDPRYRDYFAKQALLPVRELFQKTGVAPEQVTWMLAHQPSSKQVLRWADSLQLAPEKVLNTFATTGNLSAVNIPMILDTYVNQQPCIQRGDTLLFFAPGAGMHLAAMLWTY
jgi:3-oxoacyl-[acyl-carrier-protein] synthase III